MDERREITREELHGVHESTFEPSKKLQEGKFANGKGHVWFDLEPEIDKMRRYRQFIIRLRL